MIRRLSGKGNSRDEVLVLFSFLCCLCTSPLFAPFLRLMFSYTLPNPQTLFSPSPMLLLLVT